MFQFIKHFFHKEGIESDFFGHDKDGNQTTQDLYRALAVILLEAASSNHELPEVQLVALRSCLRNYCHVEEVALGDLLEVAAQLREDKNNVESFVSLIRDNFDEEQRTMLLAIIWKIVLSDGVLDKDEKRFIHLFQFRLGLSEEQLEDARYKAESGEV